MVTAKYINRPVNNNNKTIIILQHILDEIPGPPPAYESVVEPSSANKDTDILQVFIISIDV